MRRSEAPLATTIARVLSRRNWLRALTGWTAMAGASERAMARQAAPAAPSTNDPTTLSLAELSRAYAAGTLTPLDATAAYLARIDRENARLGAFVTVSRDRAVDETRRLLRAAGTFARGPLHGVPVAHKDLFRTRGVRTTGGSRLYDTLVPEDDADLVARCAAAGAVMLGKTNTHELGGGTTTINPFTGTTHNPRDLTRIAGGSSGGAAAAISARLALVATGSDTGGSIRIPAALCGCVGLKPTFGWLPTTGVLGACPTFDHVGLLTRTCEDAALAFSAVAPARDGAGVAGEAFVEAYRTAVARGLRGLRVGVARTHFFENLEPGGQTAVTRTLAALAIAGARVSDVGAGAVSNRLYAEMFDPIAVSEIRATYAADWRARPEAFSKDFAGVFTGPPVTADALARARDARDAVQRSIEMVLEQVDVLVMPTVPMVAPRIDGPIDGMRILQNTWAFNAARVPALTVPCGPGADGLPVGLQIVASPHAEARLLAAGTLVTGLVNGPGAARRA
jgi:aspartyl-tRNA(Asn)/glutamyl-tRNA(Gln) amidotransferase subunit A